MRNSTGWTTVPSKEDFNELYRQMNGMEIKEMDKIIYPVCTLCRDHQRSGFVEGVKVGIRLRSELKLRKQEDNGMTQGKLACPMQASFFRENLYFCATK